MIKIVYDEMCNMYDVLKFNKHNQIIKSIMVSAESEEEVQSMLDDKNSELYAWAIG